MNSPVNISGWKCPFEHFSLVNRSMLLRANDTLISSKPIYYYQAFGKGDVFCVSESTPQGFIYTHDSDIDRWIRPKDCAADVYIGLMPSSKTKIMNFPVTVSGWKCPFEHFRLVNRSMLLRENDTLISSEPIYYYRAFGKGDVFCVSQSTPQGFIYTHDGADRWIRPKDCAADVYIGSLEQ